MTEDPDFGKTGFARKLFRLRFHALDLSQREFADRFGLAYATMRDLEQGRSKPNYATEVLIEAIRLNARLVAKAARNVVVDPECVQFIDPVQLPTTGNPAMYRSPVDWDR
jgi:transcriptional regulator with XRE-family HTH domain